MHTDHRMDIDEYKQVLRILNKKEWTELKTKLLSDASSDANDTILLLQQYIDAYHASLIASEEFTKVEEIVEEQDEVCPELWKEYENLREVYHVLLVKESDALAELNKIL